MNKKIDYWRQSSKNIHEYDNEYQQYSQQRSALYWKNLNLRNKCRMQLRGVLNHEYLQVTSPDTYLEKVIDYTMCI